MSKRRVFDIDFPTDEPDDTAPRTEPIAPGQNRRGPMASAIGENAEALAERQRAEQAIRDENDRLAHEHVRLKRLGLITDLIPHAEVQVSKLIRDRAAERDPELEELKDSIRDLGLSNPIRVEQTERGYELIQGYRRLCAYRELDQETGEDTYAMIPAAMVPSGETIEDLYRRMVDENLVRRDISFGEMGQLAVSYLEDEANAVDTLYEAVEHLYRSASRQKRSHIRTFAHLMHRLGPHLQHPQEIPRALGTELLKRFDEDHAAFEALVADLSGRPGRDADEELALLRAAAAAKPAPKSRPTRSTTAKTTFRLSRPEGTAKCTVADGHVEMRLARDFSSIERGRLEAAMVAFFDALDD